jgi:hypothetical protein
LHLTGGNALNFSWPGNIGCFGLCEASNLAPPVAWTPVTNIPLFSSNQWTLTLPAPANSGLYYRLHAP